MECPCSSGKPFSNCCGIYLSGAKTAPTAEALMRSRYTAYSLSDIDYISRTMRGPASQNFDAEEALTWAKEVTWLGLKVIQFSQNNQHGSVEFKATYAFNNTKHELHELSEFELLDGQWFYVDGKSRNIQNIKIGRNDPCSCGSQKKFKKCCGS
jgi:SEC-C motif-containing protein